MPYTVVLVVELPWLMKAEQQIAEASGPLILEIVSDRSGAQRTLIIENVEATGEQLAVAVAVFEATKLLEDTLKGVNEVVSVVADPPTA